MTTADTPKRQIKKLTYQVTSDWHPFQHWYYDAESEIEARQILATGMKLKLEEVSASPVGGAKLMKADKEVPQ
jgi:hypothetical protein